MSNNKKYFFGNLEVSKEKKIDSVKGVFDSVAEKYDIMNDVLSIGTHRIWKDILVNSILGLKSSRRSFSHLDLASGTGDIGYKLLDKKSDNTFIFMMDINENMLGQAMNRREYSKHRDSIQFVVSDAEKIPLEDNSIDTVSIAFGIRNVASIENALSEIYRVLKHGGKFFCLEFSKVEIPMIDNLYEFYSKNIIPEIGYIVTKDRDSYQYLVESINRFPRQEEFIDIIRQAGFTRPKFTNLSGGIAAIHSGWKI
ncbi:MAG: bifunctional demethylmenaquinone methyltransferase/2-methoxy-6-polyprenyl-1,4-benzoquinol methylase UbiE [Hyphomicrobiales bacterium]